MPIAMRFLRSSGGKANSMHLDAIPIGFDRWAVRPTGQLGTCGFRPYPWSVVYVKAHDASSAIKAALQVIRWRRALGA